MISSLKNRFAGEDGRLPALSDRSVVTPLFAIAVSLLFYYFAESLRGLNTATHFVVLAFVLICLVSLAFGRLTYDSLPRVFRILSRTTAAGIAFYLLVEPPDFTLIFTDNSFLQDYVRYGYWLCLAFSIVGLWRPSFVLTAATFIITTRFVVNEISGFTLSVLDIRYMVEMAQFLSIGSCLLAVLNHFREKQGSQLGRLIETYLDIRVLSLCLAFIAIGFHFGNYFWSGVQKFFLGPMPWTWVFENETQNILLFALYRGVLPLGHIPAANQFLFDGLSGANVALNAFVLVTQLFAIVAILRLAWIKWASYFYDALHIGIYVFGGLFFWPWVWNNVSVLLAVRKTREEEVGWGPRLCFLVTILFGGTSLLNSARLAWWDVSDVKIPEVQAQISEGAWINVPVSFWLSHSYAVSHGYFDQAYTPGHYPPTIWGSSMDYQRNQLSGLCVKAPQMSFRESDAARQNRLLVVDAFVRTHHQKMLDREGKFWPTGFYLRSHHHPSNPWLHSEFNNTDIRDIQRYRLRTSSVCLALEDGELVKRVLAEDTTEIDLGN